MKSWSWSEPGVIYLVIAVALAAGLAAAYGRELEAKRRPNRYWWIRRLLIMPILAIAVAAGTVWFDLPVSVAAFSAALLSLGGYDVLCLIETRWKRRLEAIAFTQREMDHGAEQDSHGRSPRK
jgi:hypothetical protein